MLRETEFFIQKGIIHFWRWSVDSSRTIPSDIHRQVTVHVRAHVYKYTRNQGFLVSPESNWVGCLDTRNFLHLRVGSKLSSWSPVLSLFYHYEASASFRLLVSFSFFLFLSTSPLSFYVSTPDNEERTFSDRKISDRRNCSALTRSHHVLVEKSVVYVFHCYHC